MDQDRRPSGTNVAASSFYPGSASFPLAPNPGMNMHSPRYIVVNAGEQWKVVRGAPHRRFDPYPTKTQAVCAAIELAENDGDAGAEVLVRHEDGYFVTEWVHGQDPAPDKAARPRPSDHGTRKGRQRKPTERQQDDQSNAQPDEIGPQGGYGGTGPDQGHPGD